MSQQTIVVCLDDVGLELLASTPTPNIDRLREAGHEMTLWTSPSCSSTRASLMTGQYAFRHGIGDILRHDDTEALAPDIVSLPAGLRAMLGKWHLVGGAWPDADPGTHPILCGFHAFDGHLHNLGAGDGGGYWDWDRVIEAAGHPGIRSRESRYATNEITQSAVQTMQAGFVSIFVSYAAIHKPLHVAPYGHDYAEPFDKRKKAQSMLRALDEDLGLLFSAASQLGYRVILFSDNGSAEDIGGGKGTLYETGIRNLCVAYGWSDLPQNPLVHVVDLMQMLDGLPRVDSKPIGSRSWLYSEKFRPNHGFGNAEHWEFAIRSRRWKAIQTEERTMLFDLEADPQEKNDLSEEHPEELGRLLSLVDDLHEGLT